MTDNEPDDEQAAPRVPNLKSGLGDVDPERYLDDAYPPHWGYQR